jgi:hypothetical protein
LFIFHFTFFMLKALNRSIKQYFFKYVVWVVYSKDIRVINSRACPYNSLIWKMRLREAHCRWDYNIKMDLWEISLLNLLWIHMPLMAHIPWIHRFCHIWSFSSLEWRYYNCCYIFSAYSGGRVGRSSRQVGPTHNAWVCSAEALSIAICWIADRCHDVIPPPPPQFPWNQLHNFVRIVIQIYW